jgi:hypothetical protein
LTRFCLSRNLDHDSQSFDPPAVRGTTVFDDSSVDILKGNAGLDWFFANLGPSGTKDIFQDRNTGGPEQVN